MPDSSVQLQLVSWDGKQATIAPRIEVAGATYEPAKLEPSVLRAMHIPDQVAPAEPVGQLWGDIARTIASFTALAERYVTLCVSFAIATWFIGNFSTAPWLAVSGPDALVGSQLLQLLQCLCRRSLPIAAPSLATIRALPPGWRFTLLAREPRLTLQTKRLLQVGLIRDQFVPARRQLLDPFGPIATFASEPPGASSSGPCGIEIPAIPTALQPKLLTAEAAQQIARDFQPRLLGHYLRNGASATPSATQGAKLSFSMRELGRNLVACISEDAKLQAAVLDALAVQDRASQVSRWTDADVTTIESLLAYVHEGKGEAYVGEIAERAREIARARGGQLESEPRAVGAQLRLMGFETEPRDRRGYRLKLTGIVSDRIHELAFAWSVPTVQNGFAGCDRCRQQQHGADHRTAENSER